MFRAFVFMVLGLVSFSSIEKSSSYLGNRKLVMISAENSLVIDQPPIFGLVQNFSAETFFNLIEQKVPVSFVGASIYLQQRPMKVAMHKQKKKP